MRRHLDTLLLRFIRSYILIILLISVIFSFAYFLLLDTVEKSEIEYTLASLENSRKLIDTRFEEIKRVVHQFTLDTKVRHLPAVLNLAKKGHYWQIIDYLIG